MKTLTLYYKNGTSTQDCSLWTGEEVQEFCECMFSVKFLVRIVYEYAHKGLKYRTVITRE